MKADDLICALQREPGELTDSDRNELAKFVAALHAIRAGKTTDEAYDLVYGEDILVDPVGDA